MGVADTLTSIQHALDSIKPYVHAHNGDIKFVRYEDDIVYVELLGACVGCPISSYTLKLGIEERLKKQVPGLKEVRAINEE